VCLGLTVAGCGGGSSSSSAPNKTEANNAEPAAQFLKPKGKNTIPKFGSEASTEERKATSAIVAKSLKARETADFATQCETLSTKAITNIPGAKGRSDCVAALKKFAEPLAKTKNARKDTLTGLIAAMRVKGDSGWGLYHGNDGKDYAVALEQEGGIWKVGSVVTIEI
jgi:hypothetical protein